ncbi:hypothetical protein ED312_06635 [Sinomicrobium pectinilyticum]|uniref:Nucleotide modification associated domain-containing protein n=2 Tax=Sinomicrobium pectinilyticum TaxID=1084421 RepID=A0A3N0EQH5_SINP1|nr:hypothetical protein ED312_06635 [Sinomicrobium pectinilyticum]
MKITEKMSLEDYDKFCIENLPNKIPKWFAGDWTKRMGDCIYDFSNGAEPTIRKGVHNETNRERDLGGQNALLSTHFYYFGEEPRPLPEHLKPIIKKNQGHLKIERREIIDSFEKWIIQFDKNKIYADPQLRHEFDRTPSDEQIIKCSSRHKEEDYDESEETLC